MSSERGIISKYQSGVNLVVEWMIKDFLTLPESDRTDYYSPEFSFGGESWFLWIFPNGWRGRDSSGHVDLELWKCYSGRSMRQSFSLSLKTAKGEKYKEEHFTKDFKNCSEHSHVLRRFIPRSELTKKRSELVPEGALTVVCTMKNTTSAESDSEACASGSSICPLDDELHHDLKELFLRKEDCDVIIKVKDSKYAAHRLILKARSPVFASTFRHDMRETATGVVEIDDCDPSSFSDFLCFIYCGDSTLISQENVTGLFMAADKYQVLNLRAKCLEFMKKNITVDTFCETFTLALRHSETELVKLCTDYFKQNVPKIIVTVKWQTFLAENPTEGNDLLIKFFVPNSS